MNEATERDCLVMEIMAMAYAVDRQTNYAVFIDYSGHVESLTVEITESKTRYTEKLATTEFYVTGKYESTDNLGWLKAKRDQLKHIVDTHEVETSGMEEVSRRVVEYAF